MANELPSLLDEKPTPSSASIVVGATEDDVRGAMWLGHKWTRRLVLGGGGLMASAVIAAAGLWGDASLEAQRGIRSDMAAIRKDTASLRTELGALSVADRARQLEHQDHERRINRLESAQELLERYDRALNNYEVRHGITRPAPATIPER